MPPPLPHDDEGEGVVLETTLSFGTPSSGCAGFDVKTPPPESPPPESLATPPLAGDEDAHFPAPSSTPLAAVPVTLGAGEDDDNDEIDDDAFDDQPDVTAALAAADAEAMYNAHMQHMRIVRGSGADSSAAAKAGGGRSMRQPRKKRAMVKGKTHRGSVFTSSIASPRSKSGLVWLQPAYIEKLSSGAVARWQRRWFVPSDNYVRYYATEDSRKVLATVDLRHVDAIVHRKGRKFDIVGARQGAVGGTLRLRAASESEAERWTAGPRQRMRHSPAKQPLRPQRRAQEQRQTQTRAARTGVAPRNEQQALLQGTSPV